MLRTIAQVYTLTNSVNLLFIVTTHATIIVGAFL